MPEAFIEKLVGLSESVTSIDEKDSLNVLNAVLIFMTHLRSDPDAQAFIQKRVSESALHSHRFHYQEYSSKLPQDIIRDWEDEQRSHKSQILKSAYPAYGAHNFVSWVTEQFEDYEPADSRQQKLTVELRTDGSVWNKELQISLYKPEKHRPAGVMAVLKNNIGNELSGDELALEVQQLIGGGVIGATEISRIISDINSSFKKETEVELIVNKGRKGYRFNVEEFNVEISE